MYKIIEVIFVDLENYFFFWLDLKKKIIFEICYL